MLDPGTIAGTLIYGIISGIFSNQVDEEVSNNLIKKNIKKWIKKISRPVNHDIVKAIRAATLNATLIFLKDYIEKHKEKKAFLKITPTELKHIKKYIQNEKVKLSKSDFIPTEIVFNYDIEDLIKPNKYSNIKLEFKKTLITELKSNVDILPDGFENSILKGIEIENNKVDWYELMSSFFIETVKTNERVKTAIENDFFIEIKDSLKQQNVVLNLSFANLSDQISDSNKSIINKIGEIDDKLDDFIEQLAKMISENGIGNATLSPEIRKHRNKIKQKIERLSKFVSALEQENYELLSTVKKDLSNFENIDFEDIIEAIKTEKCILFLGPEISIDSNGKSLHENYFQSLNNDTIRYNSNDGFFLPGSEPKVIRKSKLFYSNIFPKQNEIGNSILEKLAQIPFKLIISYAPDDTMSRIYKKHNIDHQTYEYIIDTEINVQRDSTSKKPIIYNAFGNAAKNGKYIYSHRQFYEYSIEDPKKRLPINIETEIIDEGTSHLFLGFDFNKWHIRAMMFYFRMEFAETLIFDSKNKTEALNKDFVKKQFGANFIDTDYDAFATLLLKKSQEVGLSKSLIKTFTNNVLKELEAIRLKNSDADKLEILAKLFSELENIEKKIIANKE